MLETRLDYYMQAMPGPTRRAPLGAASTPLWASTRKQPLSVLFLVSDGRVQGSFRSRTDSAARCVDGERTGHHC